jgi:transketolase
MSLDAIRRDPVAMSREMRQTILDVAFRSHTGHIGSALSIVDVLAVLYGSALSLGDDGDCFVLSKGHAVSALYAALHAVGILDDAAIATYCRDGSGLGEHPEHSLPGIEFSTGSLGLGLSYGVGVALAARMRKNAKRCVVLVSDAELDEGVLWESVMFAGHHRLSNLTVIVDVNAQQALGRTEDVLNLDPLAPKWESFGWAVEDVDGHDHASLEAAMGRDRSLSGSPTVIFARTIFAKGVPFMERQLGWHYWSMDDDQYARALDSLDGDRLP